LLHIFLLALEVFWFLIGVEVVQGLFVDVTALSLGLVGHLRAVISLHVLLSLKLLLISFRVGVPLCHESLSSFKRPSLNVISCLREEIAELKQDFFIDAHEDDVWHWLIRSILLIF